MKKGKDILKRIAGTLALPVLMYFIMMIFCYSNGKTYYGTFAMWRTLIVDIAISATCAMGIGLQFKNGRFDFSGGGIMLLAAIIAGNVAKNAGNSIPLFLVLSLVVCVAASILVALLYVYGRIRINIATIGMVMIYEALTCLVFNGSGLNLVATMGMKKLSKYPGVLLPFLLAVLVYDFYGRFTVSGKQAALLANNQQSAVNIGIDEKKNAIISYVFSGIIFGFATVIYAPQELRAASFSTLSTVGALFSNILPVFIGLTLSVFCGDTIGILMGSVTLSLMSYGFKAVLSAEMGSAISAILMGVFVFVFNVAAAQGGNLKKLFQKKARARAVTNP